MAVDRFTQALLDEGGERHRREEAMILAEQAEMQTALGFYEYFAVLKAVHRRLLAEEGDLVATLDPDGQEDWLIRTIVRITHTMDEMEREDMGLDPE